MTKTKVLFVCLGNICRSPLAEAIFKQKIKEKGLEKIFEGDSCGTANYHIGHSPDERTIRNARKNGVEIDHAGRQLCERDLEEYDYILTMDDSNYRNAFKLTNADLHKNKISLMRDYDPKGKGEVPDPYYGGESGFQEVFEILNRSIDNFLAQVVQSKKVVKS